MCPCRSAAVSSRTAHTTMETIATDNNGSYANVKEPKQLQEVEASIPTTEVNCAAFLSAARGTGTTWTVTAKAGAASGDTFTISRAENGTITPTCTESGKGCCAGGKW